jgi:hypothetical protein
MKVTKLFAVAAVLLLGAQAARAQIVGLPFYPTPTGLGVMVSADYANPDGPGTVVALRGGAGFGPLGATAVVGQFRMSGGNENTFGATAAMKVFGGGLVPVTISAQAGFGTMKMGTTTVTTMPVGVAVRASVPLFPLKPFAVGYYMLGNDQVTKEFRATIGADFNLLLGLGAHAAYDWGKDAKSWAVGAHFNFRLPVPL